MKKLTKRFPEHESLNLKFCSVIIGGAAIAAAGAVAGGAMASKGAKDAAKTQAGAATTAAEAQLQAANNTNALQWAQYQQSLANQQPYQRGGQLAYSSLLSAMGLGNATNSADLPRDSEGNLISHAGTDLNGATTGAGGAFSTYVDGIGNVGVTNNGATNAELQTAGDVYKNQLSDKFTPSDLTLDPSYQFRLDQGNRALQNSAAARGMIGSGQNAADIINYNQGAASQEYQAAYNRYTDQQTNLFNRLSALAGTGQSAANNSSAAGQNAASQIGNTTMSAANNASNYLTSGAASTAAGQVGSANAWGSALSQGAGAAGSAWNWLNTPTNNTAQWNMNGYNGTVGGVAGTYGD
jgi:hypothetical protein